MYVYDYYVVQYLHMKEVACGCVPWRRNKNGTIEVLMILRTGGYWEFPKGKQEEGESDIETALRELKEETNVSGEITSKDVIYEEFVFKRKGEHIEKVVRLFLCEVKGKVTVKVQKSEVTDFVWLPLDEIARQATYPEMKNAARKACELLKD